MIRDAALLVLGVACAGVGGEFLLEGIVRLSQRMRIPASIVAVTFAAAATSSPELSVAIASALAGAPDLSLGDALGSNVVNMALVLGIAAVIAPLPKPVGALRFERGGAVLAPCALGALALDGRLSRVDGALLLTGFATWLVLTVRSSKRLPVDSARRDPKLAASLLRCALGVGLLLVAGRLVVLGALGIARSAGIHEFVIGAVFVSVGTSVPELGLAIVSGFRGHHAIGHGTALGSCVFNALFIVGLVAVLCPIPVLASDLVWPLLLGPATVAIAFPFRGTALRRRRGLVLLVLYAAYVAGMIRVGGSAAG